MIVSKPYKNKKDAKKDLVFLLLQPIWDTMRHHLQSLMPVDYELVDSKMPIATKGPILEPGGGFGLKTHQPIQNHNVRIGPRAPPHSTRPPPPPQHSNNSSHGTLSNIQKTIMRPQLTGSNGTLTNGIHQPIPLGNAGNSLGTGATGNSLGKPRNIWETPQTLPNLPKTESGYFGNGRSNGLPTEYDMTKTNPGLPNGMSMGTLTNGFGQMSMSATPLNGLNSPFSSMSRKL